MNNNVNKNIVYSREDNEATDVSNGNNNSESNYKNAVEATLNNNLNSNSYNSSTSKSGESKGSINNEFGETVEEAVLKYVGDLNFNLSNKNNSILMESSNIERSPSPATQNLMFNNTNNIYGSTPIIDWYLKDDGMFGPPLVYESNKRNGYDLDELFGPKRAKLDENKDVKDIKDDNKPIDEVNYNQQKDWVNTEIFPSEQEINLETTPQISSFEGSKVESNSRKQIIDKLETNKNKNNNNRQKVLEQQISAIKSKLAIDKKYQQISPKIGDPKENSKYNHKISFEESLRRKGLIKSLILEISSKVENLSSDIKGKSRFSAEEDKLLKEFISKYQEIEGFALNDIIRIVWTPNNGTIVDNDIFDSKTIDNFWISVYSLFPHRLNSSIYRHMKRLYNNFETSSKWTTEEDISLNKLCLKKGLLGQWTEIGKLLNRIPEDCRDRWRNYVSCQGKQKTELWSKEEEERLEKIILDLLISHIPECERKPYQRDRRLLLQDEHLFKKAINWNRVSELMGFTRSRIQCRYKWNKLLQRQMLNIINNEITNEDKHRIFSICRDKWEYFNKIDWDQLADDIDYIAFPKELKFLFEVKLKEIRNHKNLSLKEICSQLLNKLNR